MKVLTIDIETAPNLAHVWGLWNQNVGLSQLAQSGEVISFAAKWHGNKNVHFHSVHHDGRDAMLEAAHRYLDEADVVVHYNGQKFDIPWLNAEFVREGKTPPAPYKQVDLLRSVKKNFRFPSNKLDYVAQQLGLGAKTSHTGFDLWLKCMAGDDKAWALMKRYNMQDVRLTEKLYDRLLPWTPTLLNPALITPGELDTCPGCGSQKLEKRGFSYTTVSVYQQYRCKGCGRWSRGGKRIRGVEVR